MKYYSQITMFLCLFLSIGSSVYAAGGGAVAGNGGKGVVCRDQSNRISSIRVLDFYEADIRGIKIELGDPAISIQDKISLALSRLNAIDSKRAQRYLARSRAFFDDENTVFLYHTQLASTDDSYQISQPDGCDVEQLVVRRDPQFSEDRLWTVNGDLWGHLSNDDKAGLVLHEVIYEEALTQSYLPQTNSLSSRYLNSYVCSKKLQSLSERDYLDLIFKLGFNSATLNTSGIEVTAFEALAGLAYEPLRFYDKSDIVSNAAVIPQVVELNGNRLNIHRYVTFFPDGQLKRFVSTGDMPVTVKGQQPVYPEETCLYHDRSVKRVQLTRGTTLKDSNGKIWPLRELEWACFDNNGKYQPDLRSCDDCGNP